MPSFSIRARPLVLDAAMGTRLIARGLDVATDDPALWNLSRPEVIAEIHRVDVVAGSDAIVTNTFGANRVWLSRYGRAADFDEINRQAVAIARNIAGADRFLLGSIGPTAAGQSGAYREQADALAGVDALLLETHTLGQAMIGLAEIASSGRPIIVSLFRWESPDDFVRLADAGASVVGVNCVSVDDCLRMAEEVRGRVALPLFAKPSETTDRTIAGAIPRLLDLGVGLIGGCCGTTEADVAAIRCALDLA